MTLNSTQELGKMLGKLARAQQTTDENLTPEEQQGLLQLRNNEDMEIVGTVTLTQFTYPSTSFILDHPVYGELDSAVLELDGGYAPGSTELHTITF